MVVDDSQVDKVTILRDGLIEVKLELQKFLYNIWRGLILDSYLEGGLVVVVFAFGVDVVGGEQFLYVVVVVEDNGGL